MKYYYAIFKKSRKTVEVDFPDLPGCVTYGKDWEEALANAEDVDFSIIYIIMQIST